MSQPSLLKYVDELVCTLTPTPPSLPLGISLHVLCSLKPPVRNVLMVVKIPMKVSLGMISPASISDLTLSSSRITGPGFCFTNSVMQETIYELLLNAQKLSLHRSLAGKFVSIYLSVCVSLSVWVYVYVYVYFWLCFCVCVFLPALSCPSFQVHLATMRGHERLLFLHHAVKTMTTLRNH